MVISLVDKSCCTAPSFKSSHSPTECLRENPVGSLGQGPAWETTSIMPKPEPGVSKPASARCSSLSGDHRLLSDARRCDHH
jgi:hypothetical protein